MPRSALAVAVTESPRSFGAGRDPVGQLPSPTGPCSNISQWPNLDKLLADKSEELIRQHGVQEWALAGGFMRPNGTPCLGSPSAIAYRVLRKIIEQGVGFIHRDDSGLWWATQALDPPSTDHRSWMGLALGFPFHPAILASQHRCSLRRRLEIQQRRLVRRDRALGIIPHPARARLATICHQLELLDLILRLVPELFQAAQQQVCETVRLDCEELASAAWGSDRSNWPTKWREMVFDSVALLATLRTQRLELPQTGWCPSTRQFGTALHEVRWLTSGWLAVALDQVFLAFLERARWFRSEAPACQRHLESGGTLHTRS